MVKMAGELIYSIQYFHSLGHVIEEILPEEHLGIIKKVSLFLNEADDRIHFR